MGSIFIIRISGQIPYKLKPVMIMTWNLDHYLSLTREMEQGQRISGSRHLWKIDAIPIF